MILTVTANAAIDKRYVTEGFESGKVNRVKTCVPTAGGKGLNVSRVAKIAGANVTATGFLGGHAGQFISEHIEEIGVKSDFVWCDGESRNCLNIWDEVNKVQTEFLEPGFEVTKDDCDKLIDKVASLSNQCSVVTISGSVPKGADAGIYKKIIRKVKAAGKPVFLDTSGKLLADCISEKPTLIKPNADEISFLLGREINSKSDIVDAAKKLHEDGISIVVVSMGGEGSLVVCDEGNFDVSVPKIETVNTVGCGDSMIAGFAVCISEGKSVKEAARFASAVSAASAMRMETGFFLKEDMERLLQFIEIKEI